MLDPELYLRIEKAYRRGVDWIREVRNPDGSWGAKPGFVGDVANTYYAISLHGKVTAWETLTEQAVQWLMHCQNEDGGWGLFPGDPSFPYSTACALASLARFPELDSAASENAMRYIVKHQCNDGGWPIRAGTTSTTHTTKHVTRALKIANAEEGVIEAGIQWLLRQRAKEVAWGTGKRSPDIHMTSGILALLASLDTTEYIDLIRRGTEWCKRQQSDSGEWIFSEYGLDFTGSATYYLLSSGLSVDDPSIAKALCHILESEGKRGGWSQQAGRESGVNPTCPVICGLRLILGSKGGTR